MSLLGLFVLFCMYIGSHWPWNNLYNSKPSLISRFYTRCFFYISLDLFLYSEHCPSQDSGMTKTRDILEKKRGKQNSNQDGYSSYRYVLFNFIFSFQHFYIGPPL